jgi:hypothetical protein
VATRSVVEPLPALASAKLTETVSSGSIAPLAGLQLSAVTLRPAPIGTGVPATPQQA